MLLNVVNKRAGEPQKLIVLLTIIIGENMLLIIFLIIFFIYVEKTAWRDKDNPPMTPHETDVANGGGPDF